MHEWLMSSLFVCIKNGIQITVAYSILFPFCLNNLDCQEHGSIIGAFCFARVVIADELDYLITKDRAVLHDLFMLTTLPFSRCVLIGTICTDIPALILHMDSICLYQIFERVKHAHIIFFMQE